MQTDTCSSLELQALCSNISLATAEQTMSLSMLSTTPCKPFAARAPAPRRAHSACAVVCRAQAQEPQVARFVFPGAKTLTTVAAAALLTVRRWPALAL